MFPLYATTLRFSSVLASTEPSLGISPASLSSSSGSGGGGGGGCFIDTVSQSMSKQGLWLAVLLIVGAAICCRRKAKGSGLRTRLRSGELRRGKLSAEIKKGVRWQKTEVGRQMKTGK